jgi:hypothetical protein
MVPLRRVTEQQEQEFLLEFSRSLLHTRNSKALADPGAEFLQIY